MEYNQDKKEIKIEREINNLDKFVIDFVNLLEDYVIVSGYVSILTGRSRATEDVDLLIPEMSFEKFEFLWEKIYSNNFECINTSDVKEAFDSLKEYAIRFSRKNNPLPNMEFKIISTKIHKYSFENRMKCYIQNNLLFISPLEMQIAYKLYLGSEKDIEDAVHLYELFNEKINENELISLFEQFDIRDKFDLLKNEKV